MLHLDFEFSTFYPLFYDVFVKFEMWNWNEVCLILILIFQPLTHCLAFLWNWNEACLTTHFLFPWNLDMRNITKCWFDEWWVKYRKQSTAQAMDNIDQVQQNYYVVIWIHWNWELGSQLQCGYNSHKLENSAKGI